LLGQPLFAPELTAENRARLEADLAAAKANYEKNPNSADALIWLGRRLAYLGRYREAIDWYSQGIRQHPRDARFLRHRGHRFLTLRQLDRAVADLEAAARLIAGRPDEIEPDGQPNARNLPTSTLQSNVWYHLGLAYYLRGDFPRARRAYANCLRVSKNNDMLVATSYWYYLTLRRLGRDAGAAKLLVPIHKDMDIIENVAYHKLLLLFTGELAADDLLAAEGELDRATFGYGVGAWHLVNGRQEPATARFRHVIQGKLWPAFGHLAAEAELARLPSQ
jgi:tetratricopeptide (TPR) repeat protein